MTLSLLLVTSALFAQSQGADKGTSLGEVERELRASKHARPETPAGAPAPAAGTKPAQPDAAVVDPPPEIGEFTQSVALQTYRKDFAQLDKIADEARSTKARFPGGAWKLYTFYSQLRVVNGGAGATEADWQQHLAFLQKWISARPKSITARVALAAAYIDYAWQARGNGTADQVTPEGWRLFQARINQAANTLMEAAKLEAKCPQWYVEFEIVGRAKGLDEQQLREIFDKAVASEPDYYYVYLEEATSLLPKWGGKPGDTEAFAEEAYRRVGGQEGALLYFQIASHLCNECGDFNPELFSWPRLQEGFAVLQQRYGLSPFWLNKFARMAVVYEDKNAAAKAFARIGDNWDESVWGSREQFDAHRAWAGLAPAPRPAQKPAFALDPDTTQQLNGLLSSATQASGESRWNDAAQDLRRIISTAKPFPDTDYWLIKAYRMLAVNEQRQGHLAQAQAAMDEEVSLISHRSGPNSTYFATALFGRALLEQQLSDDGRAETDLRRALAIHRKTDNSSVQIPMEAYALAMLYRRHNRYKQAINLLQPLIPPKANSDPRKEANLGWLLEALGMSYQDMGRYQDAEAAYLRMLPILEVTLPVNSLGFVDPLSKMASLYHAMGKEADAQKIEKRLQDLQLSQSQPH